MQKTTSLCAPSRSDDTTFSRKHTADESLSLLDEEAIGRWLEASGCPDVASPEEACAEAEANPLREGLPSDSPLSESCASEAMSAEPCGEEEVRVPGEGRVVRLFGDKDHCEASFNSERVGRQLPPELRKRTERSGIC